MSYKVLRKKSVHISALLCCDGQSKMQSTLLFEVSNDVNDPQECTSQDEKKGKSFFEKFKIPN